MFQLRVSNKQFKEEAVKLSYEIGLKKASEQLGIPTTTLSSWRYNLKKHGEIVFVASGHQHIDPKTAEVRKLEKEIRKLEQLMTSLKKP